MKMPAYLDGTSETMLTGADYGLLAVCAVGIPLASYISHLAFLSRQKAGDEKIRLKTYTESFWILIIPFLMIIAAWLGLDRSWALLGLQLGTGLRFHGLLAFTVVVAMYSIWQVWMVRNNVRFRERAAKSLDKSGESLKAFFPSSKREYERFKILSFVAGVTEEVIFRGFLIWILSFWIGLWPAAAISLLIFAMAHLYQENIEAIAKVAIGGAIMTGLYLISGSLVPSILLHITIDLASNATVWHARMRHD